MYILLIKINPFPMPNFSHILLASGQPVTCPHCGARTEIILDLSHTNEQTQIHQCLDAACEEEFVVQYDEEPEKSVSP